MGFIDADTHVIENDETWGYLDPAERRFRPVLWELPELGDAGHQCGIAKSYWVVADTYARRHTSDGRPGGVGREFSAAVTHLDDVSVRLTEMDMLGIDVQLLISSFFIGVELDNPLAEAALVRSYNRWMAERTHGHTDRCPWLVVPPTRTIERALEEIEFGREHGAVGVMLKGQEHGMYLDDPFLYPIYERAQDLDMAICVHAGTSIRRVDGLPIGNLLPTPAALMDHMGTVLKGFWAVLSADFEKRFPRLRWAFLETGSTWLPLVFQQQERLRATSSREGYVDTELGTGVRIPQVEIAEAMAEKQLFVACESDEDLPYLVGRAGADRFVFGTDYCHNDVGSDPLGHHTIASRTDLDGAAKAKILDRNARTLFGIPADFSPSGEVFAPTGSDRASPR